MSKISLNSCSLLELEDVVSSLGEKPFRGAQLYEWLYNRKARSVDEMTSISKSMRQSLSEIATVTSIVESSRKVSKKDGSMKILFDLEDGERVESVLLRDAERVTACISTQVGCRMGCVFCATAQIGFRRNLSTGEILEQIRHIEQICLNEKLTEEGRLTSIVVMGMGEPLDNMENFFKALHILMDEKGYGYSHKRITVSTVGISDRIGKLFEMETPVNLAVSINASNQNVRKGIMPVSNKYPLPGLLKVIENLPVQKRKKVTFEYVLLGGVNDSKDDAYELVKLVRKLPVKFNLIRYNGGGVEGLKKPNENDVLAFQKILMEGGVQAFIRKSLGSDIWGACGQLAANYKA